MRIKPISLTPENKTFSDIMSNSRHYEVPAFQRDYSWKAEQLEELWQDIEQIKNNQEQHFMGYLVLQTQTKDSKKFQIIDGQQRITTIMLIIIAALNRFSKLIEKNDDKANNAKRKDEYHRAYLGFVDTVTLRTNPKLILNRNNKGHFSEIIEQHYVVPQRRNVTATNRKLNTSLEFFQDKLKNTNGKDLAQLLNLIVEGLLFTTINVRDDLNAYLVFETLNARGVHLSVPDLFKNYLLSVLTNENEKHSEHYSNEFDEDWENILTQLGETNFTNFLRSYIGIKDKLPNTKDLYRILKKQITNRNDVMPYLQEIKQHAPVYAALQNPDDDFWQNHRQDNQQIIACLKTLRVFSIKTPLSLLMAAFDRFKESGNFLKIVKMVEVISIRYNVICQQPTNEQEKTYNQVANKIAKGENYSLPDIKRDLLSALYPSNEEFKTAFKSKKIPSRRSSKKVIHLLRQIERHVSDGSEVSENLTLEHVLPYHPGDAWQEYFGRDNYLEAIDRLGNIALLSEPQNLGQEVFVDKKHVLKASALEINKKIASYQQWDIDSLDSHQSWMARQACAVWQIT